MRAMTDLVERLAGHKTLGNAPPDELAWLAAHGTLRQLKQGEVLSPKGVQVEGMFIVLEGHVAIFVDRGAGRHKIIEWRTGDVAGMLPYSRLVSPPGDSVALEPSTIVAIHRDELRTMIHDCHEITSILVHMMVDRARTFTSSDLHDEKMMSLGKLSAGLAHELNNPASAAVRGAANLDEAVKELSEAARAVGAASLSEEEVEAVINIRAACRVEDLAALSPIDRADREDAVASWLDSIGGDASSAANLTESGLTPTLLASLAHSLDRSKLDGALRWI